MPTPHPAPPAPANSIVSLPKLPSSRVFRLSTFWVFVVACYSAGVVLFDRLWLQNEEPIGAGFHGILGFSLGLLLVLRTNTSYDRWWEGRKLWGQLINDCRNLAIKIQTCVNAPEGEKRAAGELLIRYAFALKDHLRKETSAAKRGHIKITTPPDLIGRHGPATLTARFYRIIEEWRNREQLGGFELMVVDAHAAQFMNICGACERIQKSPLAVSYRRFIQQSILIYVVTLPWGLMDSFGWWTIPVAALCTYFLVGIELIAEEIEDPFGITADDLRLDEYCLAIERSVGEILDDAEVSRH